MLPLKTLKQIPTSRVIASSTVASYWHRQHTLISDRARRLNGQVQLQISEARRLKVLS
jgi:hypothetical protein